MVAGARPLGALLQRKQVCSRQYCAGPTNLHSRLRAEYVRRISSGDLDEDRVQTRILEFLGVSLHQALSSIADNEEQRQQWVWPKQTLGAGLKVAEADRNRVAQYTSQLAAQNAKRATQQAAALQAQRTAVAPSAPEVRRSVDGRPDIAPSESQLVSSPSSSSAEANAKATPTQTDQPQIRPSRRSVYMHGPVGTGKTMLLDLFHQEAVTAGLRVVRKHFYEFMLDLHQQIHDIQEEQPVERAANTLADSIDALCFDEFQVTDIQDAAILPRVFEVLFVRGVVVVMTSNTAPQLLYSGGLNRHVHLPVFISLIADHCTILGLVGAGGQRGVDYRRRAEAAELAAAGARGVLGVSKCGDSADKELRSLWLELLEGIPAGVRTLRLPMGRSMTLTEAAGDACLVTFDELCGADRGEADFLMLSNEFKLVFLQGVPSFTSLEAMDLVRRFVKLLDVLYDRRVRITFALAAPLDELFHGIRADALKDDAQDLSWRTALFSADGKAGMAPSAVGTICESVRATERAESRLREMGTRRYWRTCAAARDASGQGAASVGAKMCSRISEQ
mmetsp:Transcript_3861/g.7720  ORF Transcript_3861/g.7720 Transcript_3861/m.7720 type:complete len:562 (-) Transcript_3861:144-1829(-)|eukprot:CAMPEP_0172770584 /NCGR_PEP_ID=MMETSP1074-20121228/188933_1 /TAXON_ID=2916 /ORGANISM="Ceratium fusus, Strain PA161109" /LENGTH=561 /DNA_ID=CAMNT_0013606371 /DNA_START=56 /DNA_END=1741 /DNA_ORIENTATION=-